MAGIENKLFTLMVVGNNPDEIVKKYDANLQVEPYVKYYYKDASKYRKKAIKTTEEILSNSDKIGLSEFVREYLSERVMVLKRETDFEYYTSISNGCSYDLDGNAISTENPDGKWDTCRIGRNLCTPFKLKNGSESLQARAMDVDWDKMHMANVDVYEAAWQLFNKEREPVTETDKKIYENVKNKNRYFEGFSSQEDYVSYSCSYWCYAYVDENGWKDADGYKDYAWITGYYDKFVKKLKPDDYISLYECSRK